MPKRRRRSFTPQFKAQVVLEVLSGQRSASESARQHELKPELISRRKDIALEGWEVLVEGDDQKSRGRAPHHGAESRKKVSAWPGRRPTGDVARRRPHRQVARARPAPGRGRGTDRLPRPPAPATPPRPRPARPSRPRRDP